MVWAGQNVSVYCDDTDKLSSSTAVDLVVPLLVPSCTPMLFSALYSID